jgi:hypothetical protein
MTAVFWIFWEILEGRVIAFVQVGKRWILEQSEGHMVHIYYLQIEHGRLRRTHRFRLAHDCANEGSNCVASQPMYHEVKLYMHT